MKLIINPLYVITSKSYHFDTLSLKKQFAFKDSLKK